MSEYATLFAWQLASIRGQGHELGCVQDTVSDETRAASGSAGEAKVMHTFIDGSKDTVKSTERMRELVEGSMDMLRDIEDVSGRSPLSRRG